MSLYSYLFLSPLLPSGNNSITVAQPLQCPVPFCYFRVVCAALATVVDVLIEVPVIMMLVGFCKQTTDWFDN